MVAALDEGAVRRVDEEDPECEDKDEAAEAVADVNEDSALGRRSSGVMVVNKVAQVLSSGLKLRRLSPRPSAWVMTISGIGVSRLPRVVARLCSS